MARIPLSGLALTVALALVGCASGATAPSPPSSAAASIGPSVVASPSAGSSAAGAPSDAGASAPPDPSACSGPATATTAQTEGPYFKAGSPERSDLTEPGMTGTPLTLVLQVVTTDCTPVEGAVIDLWQADASGTYDNSGYTLRGHTTTDANGRVVVQTIVPGEYPGRTEHVHVKVTPPAGSTLTTQLYFPGVTTNDQDGIYSPDLVLDITTTADGLVGTFTFVVEA